MSPDQRSLDRLAKVCNLLGSDQLGERAAAALRADAIRQQMGVSWADLLAPVAAPTLPPFNPKTALPAAILARCGPVLTEWERDFLKSIGTNLSYSSRQIDILARIRAKCVVWIQNGGQP